MKYKNTGNNRLNTLWRKLRRKLTRSLRWEKPAFKTNLSEISKLTQSHSATIYDLKGKTTKICHLSKHQQVSQLIATMKRQKHLMPSSRITGNTKILILSHFCRKPLLEFRTFSVQYGTVQSDYLTISNHLNLLARTKSIFTSSRKHQPKSLPT